MSQDQSDNKNIIHEKLKEFGVLDNVSNESEIKNIRLNASQYDALYSVVEAKIDNKAPLTHSLRAQLKNLDPRTEIKDPEDKLGNARGLLNASLVLGQEPVVKTAKQLLIAAYKSLEEYSVAQAHTLMEQDLAILQNARASARIATMSSNQGPVR